jgi:hypothetical protein
MVEGTNQANGIADGANSKIAREYAPLPEGIMNGIMVKARRLETEHDKMLFVLATIEAGGPLSLKDPATGRAVIYRPTPEQMTKAKKLMEYHLGNVDSDALHQKKIAYVTNKPRLSDPDKRFLGMNVRQIKNHFSSMKVVYRNQAASQPGQSKRQARQY